MNAGLRAAVNDVRFRRIPIAAEIDGIEGLGSADVIGLNTCVVGSSESGIARGDDCKLRTFNRVGSDAYSGRCIDQYSRGTMT